MISRRAAIDLFPDDDLEYDTKGGYIAPHLARQMICELPFVQPDHTADVSKKVDVDDCISRQAAIDAMKDALDPHIVQFVKSKMAIEALPSAQPEPHWIPCSEKMPSETVIATVETKAFKHRYVCEAVWIPRWTWKASFDEWEDCSEYNEDDDEYYVLEGWYERVHNWDEYAYVAIDDNVIAWMPMPIPYCGGNGE